MTPNKRVRRRKLTRDKQHDLDLEISFMEGIVKGDAGNVDAWKALREDYFKRGKMNKVHEIDMHLDMIKPNDPLLLYNLACSASVEKKLAYSKAVLEKAIACGFSDLKWIMKDPELSNLRRDPLFKEFLVRAGKTTTS